MEYLTISDASHIKSEKSWMIIFSGAFVYLFILFTVRGSMFTMNYRNHVKCINNFIDIIK